MPFEIFKDAALDPNLSLLVLLFLIILLLQLIFYGLIFPALVIFDLKNSNTLSKSKKIFWLISVLLTWTFSALAYSLFISEKKNLKIMTCIFILTCIIQAVLIGYLFFNCRQPF
jgi:hypothetical protein